MQPEVVEHGWIEDGFALAVGAILIAIGLAVLRAANLVTGGMAGLALLASHFVLVTPGILFAVLNLPFFALAFRLMGSLFTVRTIALSAGIAFLAIVMQQAFHIDVHRPGIAALVGGTLLGMGTLSAVRHGTGVGGVGVLTVWLYQKRGWNVGRTQLLIDLAILGTSALFLPAASAAWSLVSATTMGAIVFLWHRPGRYAGVSLARLGA